MSSQDRFTKIWVKTQEALIEAEDRIAALDKLFANNRTAALNPAREAMETSLNKTAEQLLKDISEIEKNIPQADLERLYIELEAIRNERKRKNRS